jgi:putative phage-type endonuclease
MTISAAQRSERKRGLGGSDAAAYCGIDPRKTRLQLYLEKTAEPVAHSEMPPEPAPPATFHQDANRMAWGTRLEKVLLAWGEEQLGRAITTPTETYWREDDHFERPFMCGNLDGLTAAPMEIVEAKTCDKFEAAEYGDAGTDAVPVRHVLQCHHYMLVTGIKLAHLFALIGGNDSRAYVIPYDNDVGELLLAKAREFWTFVVDKKPPPPTTLEDTRARWPTSVEKSIKADSQCATQLLELVHQRKVEREAAERADKLEVLVQKYMGDHAVLTDPRGFPLATWRTETRHRFDTKRFAADQPTLAEAYRVASTSRTFRIK